MIKCSQIGDYVVKGRLLATPPGRHCRKRQLLAEQSLGDPRQKT